MLTYDLAGRGHMPLYEALCRCIRADIWAGRLAPGTQLPSRRALAQHLGISIVTVESAYAQLVDEGCLTALPRRGYFVAAVGPSPVQVSKTPFSPPLPSQPVYQVDFTSNHLQAAQFPFSVWAKLTRAEITARGAELLQPVPYNGVLELRQAIAGHLRQFRGLQTDPSCIVVGAGTEYLYHMLIQFLGRERCYAVEDPGYGKIPQIYQMNGAAFCYVGMDRQGIRMDELAQSGASVVHISTFPPEPSPHWPGVRNYCAGVRPRRTVLFWRTITTVSSASQANPFLHCRVWTPVAVRSISIPSPRPSRPPSASAIWCCRRSLWRHIRSEWPFIPPPCRRWSSMCWPGFCRVVILPGIWGG